MDKEHVLERFQKDYPTLLSMGAEIQVSEIIENEKGEAIQPPIIEIQVWHPFIFDKRLIPTGFLGLKVTSIVYCNTIPEWFTQDQNASLVDSENPTKYMIYVHNHLEEIRSKLGLKSLGGREAMDAITGNFEEHINYWKNLKKSAEKQ